MVYVTLDGGLDCILHLLTTYTNNSELQVITAPSLISTLYKSPQYTLSLFPARCVFTSRSLVTACDSGDSSDSARKSFLNGGSPPTDSFLHRLRNRTDTVAPVVFLITPRHGPRREHRSFSHANRCSGNVFAEPLPSSGRLFLLIKNQVHSNGRHPVVCFAAVA
jgi:hypothetical protein